MTERRKDGRDEIIADVLREALGIAEVFEVTRADVEDWAARIAAAEKRRADHFRGAAEMAARMRRWNRWRRGEGEYSWEAMNEMPPPQPETAKEFGELLDAAAEMLERISGAGAPGCDKRE